MRIFNDKIYRFKFINKVSNHFPRDVIEVVDKFKKPELTLQLIKKDKK